ncbi:peptidase S8 and S53 domain-containing protein [Planoprotostelium fungivorum]|uniref:Peptidase S8 and S53 domain-containing protein n=1 Tax=Planoprotostelium fungivorum TaxID=1890364 RepID=A0A2P6NYU2_9EUKA|nr:peptidase S8 and S53 domain-containing protein [Planoprotostelium fungivorum]
MTTVVAERHQQNVPAGFKLTEEQPNQQEELTAVIHLKQENKEELKNKLDAVSDPKSSEYGKYLTREQVEAMTAAKPEHIDAVKSWLSKFQNIKVDARSDAVHVTGSLEALSKVFNTQFGVYESNDGKKHVRINGKAVVPSELEGVEFVSGLSELMKIHHGPAIINKLSD